MQSTSNELKTPVSDNVKRKQTEVKTICVIIPELMLVV